MSPEFILRPSLSAAAPGHRRPPHHRVSPEFILRPSLSALRSPPPPARVAGVYTPAFVERSSSLVIRPSLPGVSPEFILRPSLSGVCIAVSRSPLYWSVAGVAANVTTLVSPELMLRPSLSG